MRLKNLLLINLRNAVSKSLSINGVALGVPASEGAAIPRQTGAEIARINAATRLHGLSYSLFINGLLKSNINLNRKVLSHLAVTDEKAFAGLVETAKKGVGRS